MMMMMMMIPGSDPSETEDAPLKLAACMHQTCPGPRDVRESKTMEVLKLLGN